MLLLTDSFASAIKFNEARGTWERLVMQRGQA
jgi:hypothetical protein